MPPSSLSKPIRIGLLHSLTGTMALSEVPLVDAALMAIAEINRAGGVLGRPLEPVIRDGGSNPEQFAAMAQALIEVDQVATVFGCWTSLSRKAMLPVFAAHRVLLWYPVQYEGLEQSPWVFYSGSCPNQQVEPALEWLLAQGKRRMYLLGGDYVFPRVTNKILKGQLHYHQGELAGEAYIPLGTTGFEAVIQDLLRLQPDVVFSTLNGGSNLAFYQQFQAAGLTPEQMPIMAMSVAEAELQRIGPAAVGHYACRSYFQSLNTPANRQFVTNFKQRYGAERVTSAPIQTAYTQVYLWRQAVEQAQTVASEAVRAAAYGQRWRSPSGEVCCEPNHHLQKECHIGQAQTNSQFRIVYSSPGRIQPLPWLGVEAESFAAADVVIDMLGEVSRCVQYSWELEQQSRRLEQTMAQLHQEMAQRQQAEADLTAANAKITSLNQALEVDNSRMSAELSVARQLQQMILPTSEELAAIAHLDIAGFMEAAEEVGGDYYDVLQGNSRRVTIGIGDVTGHGLESGVLMIMAQTTVRILRAFNVTDPVVSFNTLNQVIYQNRLRMGSLRNLSLALIDYQDGKLAISGQHEEVIVVRASGTVERVDTFDLGYPVGMVEDISAFVAQHHLDLGVGDTLVLYTDGITEAENCDRKFYGLDRLIEAAQQHSTQSAAAIRAAIIADVRAHIGDHTIYDDITLVVLKRQV
ncbi:transporter substrate-binding protein [Nodosilinea sp. LEGE 06152]|uniref:transporter substrate-binding protein n=1 Tax=Nodosilinea sp. LEGE 06152 TaxID=2777966 RepID=UPI001881A616|nr:transporter substrate-binding protein [Nodosilinea sp. LEGE 06152]MBE9157743.1 transporter substrate-binding protein [Nodosilinea sp. LEGE 06152]